MLLTYLLKVEELLQDKQDIFQTAQNPEGYQACTKEFCKQEAISRKSLYFTYGDQKWCTVCYSNQNGSLMDIQNYIRMGF